MTTAASRTIIQDLDGHLWEVIWMNPSEQNEPAEGVAAAANERGQS